MWERNELNALTKKFEEGIATESEITRLSTLVERNDDFQRYKQTLKNKPKPKLIKKR